MKKKLSTEKLKIQKSFIKINIPKNKLNIFLFVNIFTNDKKNRQYFQFSNIENLSFLVD